MVKYFYPTINISVVDDNGNRYQIQETVPIVLVYNMLPNPEPPIRCSPHYTFKGRTIKLIEEGRYQTSDGLTTFRKVS